MGSSPTPSNFFCLPSGLTGYPPGYQVLCVIMGACLSREQAPREPNRERAAPRRAPAAAGSSSGRGRLLSEDRAAEKPASATDAAAAAAERRAEQQKQRMKTTKIR